MVNEWSMNGQYDRYLVLIDSDFGPSFNVFLCQLFLDGGQMDGLPG